MESVRCYDCQQPVADKDISVREVRKGLMAEKKPICPACVKTRDEKAAQWNMISWAILGGAVLIFFCGMGLMLLKG